MLTQEDIKKLKKIFATKEDLKKFATKEDLKKFATKEDLKKFATKEDLKRFATKEDLKGLSTKEDLAKVVDELIELLMPHFKKMDDLIDEIRGQRVAIADHEDRIEKLEEKVFTASS
ncbi:MAG: hypothetical protein ACK4FL_02865 [Microgenomates group bacterium]